MALHIRPWVLSTVAISFIGSKYAPSLLVFSDGFLWNAVALYLTLQLANLIWSILIYPLCFSPLRHLPQAPDGHFLFGHWRRIFKDPSGEPQRDWIDTVPNDGVIYYRWLFNEPRVLITTPKALAEVLVHRNYEFSKPARIRKGLGRILGVGILIAEGDEHKRQRKALMPAFSFRHVKDLYPIFWSKSREMAQAMLNTIQSPPTPSPTSDSTPSDPSVVEIRDWASRATLDIIGVAGMGQDFHAIADPESELFNTYRAVFSPVRGARIVQVAMMLLPQWFVSILPMKRNEEFKDAIVTIKKVAADLIKTKREKLADGKGREDVDILSVAIESGGFSDDDLVNQLMTFLAAGHETTASAVTWAIYLLCKHPDVQTKLREELRDSGLIAALHSKEKAATEEITSRHIDNLPYLNGVLSETLRLFPPVPLTMRESPSYPTTIAGSPIPPSTTVIICPWANNTSTALWGPDAREFNPERWIGPGRANTGGAESNFATTTFLHGPRSCIGMSFARGEFACLMAALVGAFEVRMRDDEEEIEIAGGITARPRNGLWVKLTPVEQGRGI